MTYSSQISPERSSILITALETVNFFITVTLFKVLESIPDVKIGLKGGYFYRAFLTIKPL